MPRTRQGTDTLARRLVIGGLFAGWLWIAWASLPYAFGTRLHPFVVEKLPHSIDRFWRAVLHVHVASALIGLPACAALLSETLRRRALRVHRLLGRVAATVLLFGLVPTGSILAFTATGGIASTLGFLLSGAITAVAMVLAVAAARRGEIAEHQRAIRHVVGQMSVAVISRALLVAAGFFDLDPTLAYLGSLWLPVLGVAWAAERLSRPEPHAQPRGALMHAAASRLVLLLPLALAVPRAAQAAPATAEAATAQLDRALLTPLATRDSETSRFSRASRPPAERRVRLTQTSPTTDATGAAFFAFAVDTRWSRGLGAGTEWAKGEIIGCVYPTTGEIYVDQGGTFMAASWLFGESADDPRPTVCQPPRAS